MKILDKSPKNQPIKVTKFKFNIIVYQPQKQNIASKTKRKNRTMQNCKNQKIKHHVKLI